MTPQLVPGECRKISLRALACCCARCAHEWIVYAKPGEKLVPPKRCAGSGCDARSWADAVPKPVGWKLGRPRGKAKP